MWYFSFLDFTYRRKPRKYFISGEREREILLTAYLTGGGGGGGDGAILAAVAALAGLAWRQQDLEQRLTGGDWDWELLSQSVSGDQNARQ